MLHVLNGDATATVFETAGIPGERIVCRDILVEGPATASVSLDARAVYLADYLGLDGAAYARGVEEQTARLAGASGHDEIVLWFEQDLFCAVMLWWLLDRLARQAPAARLSLVYPPVDDNAPGLGAMPPARLAVLFGERRPVTEETRALGARAWAAYAGPDPLAGAALDDTPELPFVRDAFRCHWGRFPAVANGLNEVEGAALGVLQAGRRRFGELFREVSAHPRVRRHGMGDLQLAACLRRLAPLVRPDGAELMQATLEITPLGRDVVALGVDWLRVHAIDAWLGGVHLRRGGPLWRWDGARQRLVPSAA
jgi:hypothetical protein